MRETLGGRLKSSDCSDSPSAQEKVVDEWKPISTAPPGAWLLLWWVPVDGNMFAEACINGQVSADGKTYWDGIYPGDDYEKGYKPIERVTHWMLPPERPTDRPPYEPDFAQYLKDQRASLLSYAEWKSSQVTVEGSHGRD